MEKENDDAPGIEFVDRRRIKSVDDSCDDAAEADLERIPTAFVKLKDEAEQKDERLREYIAAYKEKMEEMVKAADVLL